jgi:hypothetical protein
MFKPTILVVEKVFGVNMFLQINVRSLITKTVFYLHTGPINSTNSVLMEIFLLLIEVFSDVMVFMMLWFFMMLWEVPLFIRQN